MDREPIDFGFMLNEEKPEFVYARQPTVYQINRDSKKQLPFIELGAVNKFIELLSTSNSKSSIIEFYCREIVDTLQCLLTTWNEKKLNELLFNDSTLLKCERCGVISQKRRPFKKSAFRNEGNYLKMYQERKKYMQESKYNQELKEKIQKLSLTNPSDTKNDDPVNDKFRDYRDKCLDPISFDWRNEVEFENMEAERDEECKNSTKQELRTLVSKSTQNNSNGQHSAENIKSNCTSTDTEIILNQIDAVNDSGYTIDTAGTENACKIKNKIENDAAGAVNEQHRAKIQGQHSGNDNSAQSSHQTQSSPQNTSNVRKQFLLLPPLEPYPINIPNDYKDQFLLFQTPIIDTVRYQCHSRDAKTEKELRIREFTFLSPRESIKTDTFVLHSSREKNPRLDKEFWLRSKPMELSRVFRRKDPAEKVAKDLGFEEKEETLTLTQAAEKDSLEDCSLNPFPVSEESETTTAFSSSSAENMIRQWVKPVANGVRGIDGIDRRSTVTKGGKMVESYGAAESETTSNIENNNGSNKSHEISEVVNSKSGSRSSKMSENYQIEANTKIHSDKFEKVKHINNFNENDGTCRKYDVNGKDVTEMFENTKKYDQPEKIPKTVENPKSHQTFETPQPPKIKTYDITKMFETSKTYTITRPSKMKNYDITKMFRNAKAYKITQSAKLKNYDLIKISGNTKTHKIAQPAEIIDHDENIGSNKSDKVSAINESDQCSESLNAPDPEKRRTHTMFVGRIRGQMAEAIDRYVNYSQPASNELDESKNCYIDPGDAIPLTEGRKMHGGQIELSKSPANEFRSPERASSKMKMAEAQIDSLNMKRAVESNSTPKQKSSNVNKKSSTIKQKYGSLNESGGSKFRNSGEEKFLKKSDEQSSERFEREVMYDSIKGSLVGESGSSVDGKKRNVQINTSAVDSGEFKNNLPGIYKNQSLSRQKYRNSNMSDMIEVRNDESTGTQEYSEEYGSSQSSGQFENQISYDSSKIILSDECECSMKDNSKRTKELNGLTILDSMQLIQKSPQSTKHKSSQANQSLSNSSNSNNAKNKYSTETENYSQEYESSQSTEHFENQISYDETENSLSNTSEQTKASNTSTPQIQKPPNHTQTKFLNPKQKHATSNTSDSKLKKEDSPTTQGNSPSESSQSSRQFENQISYDSSKIILSDESECEETDVLSTYQRILKSGERLSWPSFQQLVEKLHPDQKDLWSDICKAISNEAKRVANESGCTTEVSIEINPISEGEREGKVEASAGEITFEMDMKLKDVRDFLRNKFGEEGDEGVESVKAGDGKMGGSIGNQRG